MDELPTAAVLRRAADLVESGWTQWAEARDGDGHKVTVLDPATRRYCMSGAIHRGVLESLGRTTLLSRDEFHALVSIGTAVWRAGQERGIPFGPDLSNADWNNRPERTADEVISLLRRAAEIANADQPPVGKP